MIRLGIDTGGTCTDAVLFDTEQNKNIAMAKAPTTHSNLEVGIGMSIDKLPAELLQKVEYMSLSTTLATNACVENKGGRVKLIYIGVNRKVVEQTYQSYGFESMEGIYFTESDFSEVLEMLRNELHLFDSIAIAQIHANEDDAALEKALKSEIQKFCDKPIVCAYELYHDLNVVKRGATAYLNARLLPIIAEFLRAIHEAMHVRKLSFPLVIMRSDGSLMSEEYASQHPVETLLCGPAASLKGGEYLMKRQTESENCVVVDIGGTTTDIALIKDGRPVMAAKGAEIGSWNTFVKGLYVHTFGLGGDSEVCYGENGIEILDKRVISVSALAGEYPFVVDKLAALNKHYYWGHTKPLYSFVVLQKRDCERSRFTEDELKVIDALADGPLMLKELAEQVGRDLYVLNLSRLEKEGIVIRSGLTPTDAMVVQDRLTIYDKTAANLAFEFVAANLRLSKEEIMDQIFELVYQKLYKNIARVILEDTMEENSAYRFSDEVESLVMQHYFKRAGLASMPIQLNACFVGVGAPTAQFLPVVAEHFNAECVTPKEAGVANALGAIIGDVRAMESVRIETCGAGFEEDTEYRAYLDEGVVVFGNFDLARERAIETARRRATKRALEQGAIEIVHEEIIEKKQAAAVYGSEMLLGAVISVEVIGKLGV